MIRRQKDSQRKTPPEPHCAWYYPIHYFGNSWGIYIREECILSIAIQIACCVNWRSVNVSPHTIFWDLLRSSFYVLFLHEQFHHKVESFGFRLLVSTGTDLYRPYKRNVYRSTYLTYNCLEESLANAESYRRLNEVRYSNRVTPEIREGVRIYLKAALKKQPPGYREGIHYLSETNYRRGLYELQSRILDGTTSPTMRFENWSVAPNMIKSLANIADEIYVVLPVGRFPIFSPTTANPAPPLLVGC